MMPPPTGLEATLCPRISDECERVVDKVRGRHSRGSLSEGSNQGLLLLMHLTLPTPHKCIHTREEELLRILLLLYPRQQGGPPGLVGEVLLDEVLGRLSAGEEV